MKDKILLKENERIEDLHVAGYKLIQDKKNFMFGIDAVLLSDFASCRKKDTVVDFCSGTGIIPVLMRAKYSAQKITAVEVQEKAAQIASRNFSINEGCENYEVINDNLKNAAQYFKSQSVDVVTCNPPYYKKNTRDALMREEIFISRHEILCSFEDIAKSVSYILKPNGKFFLIHKPERLSDVICALNKFNMEAKVLRFVESFSGEAPSMFLMEAVKCASSGLKILEPLVIYKEKGVYSDEVSAIYGR